MRTTVTTHLEEPRDLTRRKFAPVHFFVSINARARCVFCFTPRHIERRQFSLKIVYSQSKHYCLYKNNDYKNNSKCVYTTNYYLMTELKFVSRCFLIMRNQKFTNSIFPRHSFVKKTQIYFRSVEKEVYFLNHY
jgi:hypothetical protein